MEQRGVNANRTLTAWTMTVDKFRKYAAAKDAAIELVCARHYLVAYPKSNRAKIQFAMRLVNEGAAAAITCGFKGLDDCAVGAPGNLLLPLTAVRGSNGQIELHQESDFLPIDLFVNRVVQRLIESPVAPPGV